MDHFLVIIQILFLSIGAIAVASNWVLYSQSRSRNQLAFAVFFSALAMIVGINTFLTYTRLNLAQGEVHYQYFFLCLEQIPRVIAMISTVVVAGSVLPLNRRNMITGIWVGILILGTCLMFIPQIGGVWQDKGNGVVIGIGVYTANTVQLSAAVYSIVITFLKYKPLNPTPAEKLIRFWVVLSAISIPGMVLDFVIYPQVVSQGIFVVPVLAFYRLYFFVLAAAVLYFALRHIQRRLSQVSQTQSLSIDELGDKYSLTPREKEILTLLLEGSPNQYIGEKLGVSLNTVKTHVYNIFQKTGSGNRVELLYMLQGVQASGKQR